MMQVPGTYSHRTPQERGDDKTNGPHGPTPHKARPVPLPFSLPPSQENDTSEVLALHSVDSSLDVGLSICRPAIEPWFISRDQFKPWMKPKKLNGREANMPEALHSIHGTFG